MWHCYLFLLLLNCFGTHSSLPTNEIVCFKQLDKMAIATIAVGWKARSFGELLLLSYARNAKTNVPLYLLTDDIQYYFDLLKSEQALESVRDRVRPVPLDLLPLEPALSAVAWKERRAQLGANVTLFRNAGMKVRMVKSQLLELVPASFDYVLYVDSDMLFGARVRPLLCSMLAAYTQHADTQFAVYPYKTDKVSHATAAEYHGGVFLAHRRRSAAVLHEWGERIRLDGYEHDQHALVVAVNNLQAADHMYFLSFEGDNGEPLYTFIGPEAFTIPPFPLIHTTVPRLLHPARWNFTLAMARHYYNRVLHLPFQYDFLLETLPNRWKSAASFLKDMRRAFLTARNDERYAKARLLMVRIEIDLLGDPADLGTPFDAHNVVIDRRNDDDNANSERVDLLQQYDEVDDDSAENKVNPPSTTAARVDEKHRTAWRLLRRGRRSEQLANLTRWLDQIEVYATRYRWMCGNDGDEKRGLLGFVVHYARSQYKLQLF